MDIFHTDMHLYVEFICVINLEMNDREVNAVGIISSLFKEPPEFHRQRKPAIEIPPV